MTRVYDQKFYDWVNMTAIRSARALLPIARGQARPRSVLDVGCGQGAWLKVWDEMGVKDLQGVDGDYVRRDALVIPPECFTPTDLGRPWDVGRRFDLVQSLEVAEHLPPASAEDFVRCLCAHGDIVLFSAAQPGQGGERHINERPPSYWAHLFANRGFEAYDCLRPLIAKMTMIDPWYRYNTVLYANEAGAERLDPEARRCRIEGLGALDGGGDLRWRLRRALLRPAPEPVVTFLSRVRYRLAIALASA
jgi:SAM-dependent methyltransferase